MTEQEIMTTETPDVDYINAIQELQANTVSKDLYDKLKDEKQRLLNALVKGEKIEGPKKAEPNIGELRQKLFDKDSQMSNLEFVSKSLELRDALIEKGEPDPFLPIGSRIAPTNEDLQQAENVAQVYRECIEYAQGDSEVFTNELMRRTVDAMPSRARRSR